METPEITLTEDQKIELMLAKLEQKRAEVERADKPCYLTGGNFKYSEDTPNGGIDITTVRDERKLVAIAAFLIERSNAYEQAAKELGSDATFTWLGFKKDEWMSDLQTKVNILQIAKKRAELRDLEALVNELVSPELQKRIKMAEASKRMAALGIQ